MVVQHLLKHCKYYNTVLLAYNRVRVETVMLRNGKPSTHTKFLISLLIFIEQGNENHHSGNHTALY